MFNDWTSSFTPNSQTDRNFDSAAFTFQYATSAWSANLGGDWADTSYTPPRDHGFDLWFEGASDTGVGRATNNQYRPGSDPSMSWWTGAQGNEPLPQAQANAQPTAPISASDIDAQVVVPGIKLIVIKGLQDGAKVFYKVLPPGPPKPGDKPPDFVPARPLSAGQAAFSYQDPFDKKQSVIVKIDNPGSDAADAIFGLKVVGTRIAGQKISGNFFGGLFGSYISGDTICLPTPAEAQQIKVAAEWAQSISYLKSYVTQAQSGAKKALDMLKMARTEWWWGRSLLPNLGAVVADGSKYDKNTFWSALRRLALANDYDRFVNKTFTEAAFKTDPRITELQNLTVSTAGLGGFLMENPEVRGHMPVKIVEPGKLPIFNYEFSLFVRSELIRLNYTLTGKYAAAVKTAVKKAADLVDLGFLIDGKSDAWDSQNSKVRGRELPQTPDGCPALPFLDIGVVTSQGATIGRQAELFRRLGIVGITARQTEFQILLDGVAGTLTHANEITARARTGAATLAINIQNFLENPGVIMTATDTREVVDRRYVDGLLTAMDFNVLLERYVRDPSNQQHFNDLHRFFGPNGELADLLRDDPDVTDFAVVPADDAMRIINTLMIGNRQLQGIQFLTDPWVEFPNEEVAGLRQYRQRVDQLQALQGVPLTHYRPYQREQLGALLLTTRGNCRG